MSNLSNLPKCTTNSLTWSSESRDFVDCVVTAEMFERDGQIFCNVECEDGITFADYYGEFRDECTWISEVLETWATENFGKLAYWEWENTGLLCLCK